MIAGRLAMAVMWNRRVGCGAGNRQPLAKDFASEGKADRQAGEVKEKVGKVEEKVDEGIDKVKGVFDKK